MLHIEVKNVGKKLLAMVTFKVKGATTELECQLDTAASCNVMAYQDYIKLGKPNIEKSKSLLTKTENPWPRVAEQIKKQVEGCKTCEKDAPAHVQETLLAHDVRKQPWAKVGMDLFKSRGKNYLVVVDYLTDYFEISYLPDTTAASVITVIKSDFARLGVPVVQFTSREFRSFARE